MVYDIDVKYAEFRVFNNAGRGDPNSSDTAPKQFLKTDNLREAQAAYSAEQNRPLFIGMVKDAKNQLLVMYGIGSDPISKQHIILGESGDRAGVRLSEDVLARILSGQRERIMRAMDHTVPRSTLEEMLQEVGLSSVSSSNETYGLAQATSPTQGL